jgi:hypothetical protein
MRYWSLRHIRTTQERRSWFAFEEEHRDFGIRRRSRRSFRNLPSYYDDISRGNSRSWKKHRKTQWKVASPKRDKRERDKYEYDTPAWEHPKSWYRRNPIIVPYRVRFAFRQQNRAA